jgi:hypothetical protein
VTASEENFTFRESQSLSAVADPAAECGFAVAPGEVLPAQAGRVLHLLQNGPDDEIRTLTAGGKPRTGGQWGRGGGGYLDRAGYWLLELHRSPREPSDDTPTSAALDAVERDPDLRRRPEGEPTFNRIAGLLREHGVAVEPARLPADQSELILRLPPAAADRLATA